ncbi:MAG: hypothetical protein QOK30_506 [Nocardioidaceae bacterium]|nr:hypothetical protein [Nocardioidaceae bacterium]
MSTNLVLRAAVALAAAAAFSSLPAADGSRALPRVVSENPVNSTPNVLDDATVKQSAVYAIRQAGATMYAGGTFHAVQNSSSTNATHHVLTRNNLFAFSARGGEVRRRFKPDVNGAVWALQPYRNKLFVAGDFSSVDGVRRVGIAKIDTSTGRVIRSFDAKLGSGRVTEMRLVKGRLVIGGTFPGKLVALDPRTGRNTHYIDVSVTGSVAANAGPVSVYRFAVSPAGHRLVAVGNMTHVAGHARSRAFMLDLGRSKATLASWYYKPFGSHCKNAKTPDNLRDVDFSPTGGYFVIVAGGYVSLPGDLGRTVCDAAARFETTIAHPKRPTWINYTGGDTLQSVAVTGSAVYVQGHQRWLDNPLGKDSAGPGAKKRPGIGAIDSRSGKALGWNPTKSRRVGGKDFLVTRRGLWVASDGPHINQELHEDIALLPE